VMCVVYFNSCALYCCENKNANTSRSVESIQCVMCVVYFVSCAFYHAARIKNVCYLLRQARTGLRFSGCRSSIVFVKVVILKVSVNSTVNGLQLLLLLV
jgi:hypothetical protein